ncbi:MAG: fused MFS/spermidine synthase [Nitrospirae bacterium]|nr:fused MFS/spermidine synthase [Nitrospirota bacterium]
MRKYMLESAVFLCGAAVMIYELIGSRMLAPYLGTSLIVWTSLIGVILASLSIGYWYGGRIADRKAEAVIFSRIIFFAGMLIGLTTYLYYDLLFMISHAFSNLMAKSFISTVLLFVAPSILLGMISPYAVKLKVKELSDMGRGVGNLYALSTAGSIGGTFLAGFVLIPHLGTNAVLKVLSVLLAVCSLFCRPRRQMKEGVALFLVFLAIHAGAGFLSRKYAIQDWILDTDTQYSRIQISDDLYNLRWVRLMKINGQLSSGMFRSDPDLLIPYTKYYRLAAHFNPGLKKALMIGGAGYVYPMDFLDRNGNASLDVVEIDPKVTELAQRYFGLKSYDRMRIYHEDGRAFINRTASKYDAIFNDAYSSLFSIPYQLTTIEAIRNMYSLLNDNGVVMVNIISSLEGQGSKFLRAEYKTFMNVFPQVYLFPVEISGNPNIVQNIMLVALKSGKQAVITSSNREYNDYLSHLWQQKVTADLPILTDDFAPVDYYIMGAIQPS